MKFYHDLKDSFICSWLLTAAMIITQQSIAQPHIDWVEAGGSKGWDFIGGGVLTDSDNRIYISGTFGEVTGGDIFFGNTRLAGEGNGLHVFMVKYDPMGNLLWGKAIGGKEGGLSVAEMAIDKDNSLYLTGSFTWNTDFGDTVVNSGNDLNIYLAKYDSSGSLIWVKTFGTNATDYDEKTESMAIDSEGAIYVTGYFYESIDFGNGVSLNGRDSTIWDIFIVKFDKNGKALWADSYGYNDCLATLYSLCISNKNEVYIGGRYSGAKMEWDNKLIEGGDEKGGGFLGKISKSGEVLWARFLKPVPEAIAASSDESLYLSGNFWYNFTYDSINFYYTHQVHDKYHPPVDVFVIRLDEEDKAVWGRSFSGDSLVLSGKIIPDNKNNLLIECSFLPSLFIGSDTFRNNGKSDLFMMKVSNSGEVLGAYHWGGPNSEGISDICVDKSENIYLGGTFSGTAKIGDFNPISRGYSDIFIAKLTEKPIAVKEIKSINCLLPMYPNPCQGAFTLDASKLKEIDKITVHNTMGHQVYSSTIIRHQTEPLQISLEHAPAGVYQVSVSGNKDHSTGRIVVFR